jgi:alpha-glucosidase (family GH31 glycosyl hydrolase)
MGPVRQYTAEPSDEPLTLHIYPGADGRFSLYEDDGTSFRYERGEFMRLECVWEEASRTLKLRAATGTKTPIGKKVNVQAIDRETSQLVTLTERGTTVQL